MHVGAFRIYFKFLDNVRDKVRKKHKKRRFDDDFFDEETSRNALEAEAILSFEQMGISKPILKVASLFNPRLPKVFLLLRILHTAAARVWGNEILESHFFQKMASKNFLKKFQAITACEYNEPTQIQSACIPVALAGRDICACAATGTGKTAAFMIPILERLLYRPKQKTSTRVIVLTPTRELAIQVL